MDRKQFIEELRERLKRLPEEEVENAISYYQEYFNEAGAENDEATIAALGTPANVASKIIGEFALSDVKKEKSSKTKSTSPLWIALIAIFSVPVALPLVIAVFSLVVALFAVVFALTVSGGAIAITGVGAMVFGIWAFSYGVPTGLFYLGSGMVTLAIGITLAVGLFRVGKLLVKLVQQLLGKLLVKRGTK